MPEFSVRVANPVIDIRVNAVDERDAVEVANTAHLLDDGDELTVFPAGQHPVGWDSEGAE